MGRLIAIANHKGGVGKTTTTVNIGAGLAKLGKRVLLIDFDPQGQTSKSFGIMDPENTIYNVIAEGCKPTPINVKERLDLIPSTLDLAASEMELINETAREEILKDCIKPLRRRYDYILIDCPPSLGILTINALTAAKEIFIPVQAEFLALDGLAMLMQVIDKVKIKLNKRLKISGVLITRLDERKILNRNVRDQVKKRFKTAAFKTAIHENISVGEAPSEGKSIFSYAPKSKGATDYLSLCQEIIKGE